MLPLQQSSPRHLQNGEEEESAANPRADAGDGAKTLRATKGRDERRERDDRAKETDEDKIWWAMVFPVVRIRTQKMQFN